MSFELPRWLRMAIFVLALCLTIGVGLKVLHESLKPTPLKLAVGSLDGEAARVMTALASRIAATDARVRISIVDKGTTIAAAEAFAANEADLAVVRADNEELAEARTVVLLTNLVLSIVVPAHSPVKTIGDLKGKTVGVVGLETNRRLLATLISSYGFPQGSINFVDVPLDKAQEMARSKKLQAAIFAAPLSPRYTALMRSLFPTGGKIQARILEIDTAEAIAIENKLYESFDMPKGAIRGAPPLPDEEISTLRVPVYLVARKKVSDDTISALTKAIMDARRELVSEAPLLAHISAPDDDKDAAIPAHPGAKAFFDGSEKTWSDKYGDWLFYGPLLLGMAGSFLTALWKFLSTDGNGKRPAELVQRARALIERSRKASDRAEMEQIEKDSDQLLNDFVQAQIKGQIDSDQASLLNMMIQHLERAIERGLQATMPAGRAA